MEFVSVRMRASHMQSKVPVAPLATDRVLASPVRDGCSFDARAVPTTPSTTPPTVPPTAPPTTHPTVPPTTRATTTTTLPET